MEINKDGESIARCSVNNDSTDITCNKEHQGEIQNDSVGDSGDTEIETDKSFIRKRNKKADPSSWKRNKQKELRMKGKVYKGLSKSGDKYDFILERGERVMTDRKCKENCKKRSNISEEERKRIFEQFWSNMDWNQKRVYVL